MSKASGKLTFPPQETDAPRGRLQTFKTYSDIVTSIVTILGAIAAAGWAVNEYLDKQAEGRVKTTLEYREQYNKEPILSARERLTRAWLDVEAREEEILRQGTAGTEAQFSKFTIDTIDSRHLASDVETYVEFFDVLEVCLRRNLCDRGTTLDLFGEEAEANSNQYYYYFKKIRTQRADPGFARGIDRIAQSSQSEKKSASK